MTERERLEALIEALREQNAELEKCLSKVAGCIIIPSDDYRAQQERADEAYRRLRERAERAERERDEARQIAEALRDEVAHPLTAFIGGAPQLPWEIGGRHE